MLHKYKRTKKFIKDSTPFHIKSGRFRNSKIDTLYRSDWSEDVYITQAGQNDKVKTSFDYSRLIFFKIALIFFILVLVSKIAWLQIAKGEHYLDMAEGNRIRTERLEPKRGIIYDRTLRPIVRNKANFLLYFVPIDLPEGEDFDNILYQIAEIVPKIDPEEVKAKLSKVQKYSLESYVPLFVADNIEYEAAMKLQLKTMEWPGVIIDNRTNREYLSFGLNEKGEQADRFHSLSHIIGYTGKINDSELESFGDEYLPIDYIGKMGIEYFWEPELKGVSGKKQIEVDALGKEKKIVGENSAQDGNNLVLSLDTIQQVKLEELILKHLEKLDLKKAVGILMNPQNGEIIAMVSLPTYDNNMFARGISQEEYSVLIEGNDRPLFNRAVSGEYPSGSTFKPIVAVAALEEKVVSENTTFLSTGGLRIGQWFFPDWRAGGHGRINVRSAIANSVNTYFYYIGGGYNDFVGLGVDRIQEYAKLFGLGTQTGIDLAGERDGFVPTKEWKDEVKGERWYIGDTYHLAIGQGDLIVTPLQVAMFTSVFANGGKLYRPHFVKTILDSDDKLVRETEIVPVREDFIDPYNMHVVREGLRDTVRYGSARSMQIVPAEVAGKTGTAQWSSKKENHAWFTGFAPFENPELVIAVLVEEGGEGSSVAVPIAREYFQWYFGEYKK